MESEPRRAHWTEISRYGAQTRWERSRRPEKAIEGLGRLRGPSAVFSEQKRGRAAWRRDGECTAKAQARLERGARDSSCNSNHGAQNEPGGTGSANAREARRAHVI